MHVQRAEACGGAVMKALNAAIADWCEGRTREEWIAASTLPA